MNRTSTLVLIAVGGLLLAACSSSGSTSSGPAGATAAASSATAPGGQAAPGAGRAGGFGPRDAASGLIAAVSGQTLQVQSTTNQTAVSYTSSTRFTQQRATTLAAVRPGVCVVATSAPAASGASDASGVPAAGAAPAAITATSVRIEPATAGTCSVGFGGGTRPSGFPTGARPSGFPGGNRPSGAGRGSGAPGGARRGGFGALVAGKVTAVSGSTITAVQTRNGTSTTATITVTASTTYITTAAATASAVKVGLCAVVQGSTASNGAVTARSIALSPKVSGTCTTRGFGGPNG